MSGSVMDDDASAATSPAAAFTFKLSRKAGLRETKQKKKSRKTTTKNKANIKQPAKRAAATNKSKKKPPIPSFSSELERLEREFFSSSDDEDDDNDNNNKQGKKQKSKGIMSRIQLLKESTAVSHDAGMKSILDSDTSDDEEDDLLNFDPGIIAPRRKDNNNNKLPRDNNKRNNNNNVGNTTRTSNNHEEKENNNKLEKEEEEDNDNDDGACFLLDDDGCDDNGVASPLTDSKASGTTSGTTSSSSLSNGNSNTTCSTTGSNAAAAVAVAATTDETQEPEQDKKKAVLLQALRDVFGQSDIDVHTITVKQVRKMLEKKFGVEEFDKPTKIMIRDELTRLVCARVAAKEKTSSEKKKVAHQENTVVEMGKESLPLPNPQQHEHEQQKPPPPNASPRSDTVNINNTAKASFDSDNLGSRKMSSKPDDKPEKVSGKPRAKTQRPSMAATRGTTKKKTIVVGGSGKANANSTKDPDDSVLQLQKRRRGRPAKTTKTITTTKSSTSASTTSANEKPSRKRKARCHLCSSCPCTFAENGTETINLSSLSQSDAAIEKGLMRRLHKLEQLTERHEDQTDAVRRRLKKHRRDMWCKFEESEKQSNQSNDSRFLPDARELDLQWDGYNSKQLESNLVAKAKGRMFSSSTPGNYQPTLTQMLGTRSKGNPSSDNATDDDAPLSPIVGEVSTVEEHNNDLENYPMNDAIAPTTHEKDEPAVELNDGERKVLQQHDEPTCSSQQNGREDGGEELDGALLNVLRIEVSNGVEDGDEPARIWGSCHAEFSCPWDLLMQRTKNEGVLNEPDWDFLCEIEPEDAEESQEVDTSMLSQRSKKLADILITTTVQDSEKLAAIQSACPNWRDNIVFALRQHDASDLESALEGVRDAKLKLQQTKAAILRAAEQQETALGVFENALSQSLSSLNTEGKQSQSPIKKSATANEGFFPSQAESCSSKSDEAKTPQVVCSSSSTQST